VGSRIDGGAGGGLWRLTSTWIVLLRDEQVSNMQSMPALSCSLYSSSGSGDEPSPFVLLTQDLNKMRGGD
jgi:hypothetical protein